LLILKTRIVAVVPKSLNFIESAPTIGLNYAILYLECASDKIQGLREKLGLYNRKKFAVRPWQTDPSLDYDI
jgi:hypothetical protein